MIKLFKKITIVSYIRLLLSLAIIILISGCALTSTNESGNTIQKNDASVANDTKDANDAESSEIVNSQKGLAMLNITLPEKWKLDKSEKSIYNFIDEIGEIRGTVYAINYTDNFNLLTQKPNHSSVTNDEFIDIPLGKTRIITLDCDNGTAASGITGTHDAYYASITLESKRVIYLLDFSLLDKKPETKSRFLKLLMSISLNN